MYVCMYTYANITMFPLLIIETSSTDILVNKYTLSPTLWLTYIIILNKHKIYPVDLNTVCCYIDSMNFPFL